MNNVEQARNDQSRDAQRRVQLGANKPRKPFVAKGHDAILKGIQDIGGRVVITTMGDGSEHRGKLIARDKYTITILSDDTGANKTFYKHAIESFETLPAQVQ